MEASETEESKDCISQDHKNIKYSARGGVLIGTCLDCGKRKVERPLDDYYKSKFLICDGCGKLKRITTRYHPKANIGDSCPFHERKWLVLNQYNRTSEYKHQCAGVLSVIA